MDPPWSDGIYTSDVPRDFEEMRIREERKERIGQYWDLLVADQEPKVNKSALLLLMQDLKDEGNTVFKESHFDVAWMHYRNALFIARILETRFYHDVDKEFISTLFSNRAFCCLKKEMFNEAIQDCVKAVEIHPDNIKAYYRQVQALKAQNRIAEALKIAQKGHLKQPNIFKDLITELTDKLNSKSSVQQKSEVSVKNAQTLPSSSNSVESEWLAGTNAFIPKQVDNRRTSKKHADRSNSGQQKTKSRLIPSRNGQQFSDSDNEQCSSSDDSLNNDENFASNFMSIQKQNLSGKPSSSNVTATPASRKNDTSQATPVARQSSYQSASMGLDSFSPTEAGKSRPETPGKSSSGQNTVHEYRQSSSAKKGPTLSQEDWDALYFPLENYDFRLACKQCFIKTGEGVKGYKFREMVHSCSREILLVKLKASPAIKTINWIRVRPRPESKTPKYTSYKQCLQFQQAQPCRVGDERCTFPHSKAETDLWVEDRNETFSIEGFIAKLQKLKIDTSQQLETFKQSHTPDEPQVSQPGIPGLNFKPKKTSASQQAREQEALLKQAESSAAKPSQPSHTAPQPQPAKPNYSNYSQPPSSYFHQQMMSPPPTTTKRPMFNEGMPERSPPHLLPSPVVPNYSRPPPPPHMGGSSVPHYPPPSFSSGGMPYQGRFPPPRMPAGHYQGPNPSYHPYQYPRFQSGYQSPMGDPMRSDGYRHHNTQMHPNWSQAPVPKPASQLTMEVPEANERVMIQQFPLKDTHDFKLFCKQCFVYSNYPGYYVFQPKTHKCEENILAVTLKGHMEWMRIRERKNHREFPGKYILCNSVYYNNSSFCRYGEDVCSFAHNQEEQSLWTMEKDEKFNITEFIMQNRSQSTVKSFSLVDVLKKHGGTLDFICRACFYNTPRSITKQGHGDFCAGRGKHEWTEYKILAHTSTDGMVTIINPRGFLHKTAFFKICKWLQYCRNKVNAECRFAHSVIERDIWMLERDSGMTRDDIVNEMNNPGKGTAYMHPERVSSTPKETVMPGALVPNQASVASHSHQNLDDDSDTLCPYTITAICQTCWKNGKKSVQDGDKDRCVKSHSNWRTNRLYLNASVNREVRPLPRKIPAGYRFIICKYIREQGKKCGYTGGGHCQFAHSQDEIEVWQWMCAHDVKSLEDLTEISKEAQKVRASQVKSKIQGGESVVSTNKSQMNSLLQIHTNFNPLYCAYCGKQCNSQKQWDEHCASEKHNFNVNSDKEHQWNYRQPPWGLPGSNYEICSRHMNDGKCYYSHVPDMYNMCRYAHSQDELDEWKERFEWRVMKREMARQEMVFSYMDQILEKYENSDAGVKVISEELEGVDVTCNQELIRYEKEKNVTCSWSFEIKTQNALEKVALLHNKDRLHFCIYGPGVDRNCQIVQGTMCNSVSANNVPCFKVSVQFTASMFGSFSQWVIFDFGCEPVLVKKLSVEVGTMHMHEKVRSLREQLQFDRWTSETREIVKYENNELGSSDDLDKKVASRYKAPLSSSSVVTQNSLTELNRNNYVHKMKKLLELEEITRHQIISSYNLCVNIDLIDKIQEDGFLYKQQGVLFAKAPLNEYLTEDTDAGKLILSSVRRVLLAPINQSEKIVYEATIVDKENFGYDGRGKEYIYLSLSHECVNKLGLMAGNSINVEIQFQMDRLPFCRMHFAVDQLHTTDTVFPDISKFRPQWNEKHTLKVSSNVLNVDQIQAVKHIVAERTGYTPPFVMYGPFGTGKTETLAQAAMVLLREKPECRILICAQSNSAADLYILKHLDPFLKKNPAKLRRIYFKERRVHTVHKEVQNFCLLSPDGQTFAVPTKEDIMKHQIVIVTLSSSLILTGLGLFGYFTHIFIDEAAQALEPETIMPLTLATEKTCVVLAGDQLQISPKVYSKEACNQKFNVSLLERLYQYYDSLSNRIDQSSPVNILLSINYRTKKEIVRFISATFYGGPEKLESQANLPSIPTITPLMFYAVQGVEVQETDSTSYYNLSEIEEVVERVKELYHNWPAEWGPVQAQEIGVVTPYYDQVQYIRRALRRVPGLRAVVVERINNMQGKEFRALFISTVRTRSLLDSPVVQPKSSEMCESEGMDFGFLTDPKLLNTALTRAQSFVAVVGDPIALCSVGECLIVWRTFLKHCQNMKSIYPPDLTLESIRQQVSNLLNSPSRERIHQMAMQEKQQPMPSHPTTSGVSVAERASVPINAQVSQFSKGVAAVNVGLPRLLLPPDETPSQEVQCDFVIEAEQVIHQLAMEGKSKKVDISTVKVKEDNEQAIICCMGGGSDDSEDEDDDTEVSGKVFTEQQLRDLLRTRRAQYKVGTLRVKAWYEIFVEVHDTSLPYHHIVITNRQRCGRAFNGDEVVVELLPNEKQEQSDKGMPHGQVVGVLRHHVDPKNRTFVCSVAPSNTSLMMPINTDLPCIYNVFTKSHLMHVQKGYVCVYKLSANMEYVFSEYVKVNAGNPSDRLFIVRYLKWDSSLSLPVGIVVGYMPAGSSLQKAMQILDVEYQIPKRNFKADTTQEVQSKFHHGFALSTADCSDRYDLRKSWTFTIDAPANEELSNAVSVEQLPDDNYMIGVHVSDVQHFFMEDNPIDKEARERGMSFKPLDHSTVHMLPPRLSTDLCSLKPGSDRLAISIFLTVSGSGVVLKVAPKKTVINTKKAFSFQDVQEALNDPNAGSDYLKSCVLVLYHISLLWRKERLGNASKYLDMKIQDKMTPEAHIIVQELMHVTNHQVAKLLVDMFPSTTPIFCQQAPGMVNGDKWKQEHASDAVNSIALTKPFLEGPATCNCKLACTCIMTYMGKLRKKPRDPFDMYTVLWESVCQAADSGEMGYAQSIVIDAESHPQLTLALKRLHEIQHEAVYRCSGDVTANMGHYSLNLSPYVHFTNPLSRYMDIVVQRMVSAAIEGNPSSYSLGNIQTLCSELNVINYLSTKYEEAVYRITLASALKARPVVLHPVIEDIDVENISLCFPLINNILADNRLDVDLLKTCQTPAQEEGSGILQLNWQDRIYDVSVSIPKESTSDTQVLNPNRFICRVPAFQWQKLLSAIRDENVEKLQAAVKSVRPHVKQPSNDTSFVSDIVVERYTEGRLKHFVDFSMTLSECGVVQLQMAAQMCNGLLTPSLQLLNLTPSHDICLEHRSDPTVFTNGSVLPAAKPSYMDEDDYQNSWLPVLAIEAAHNAVQDDKSSVVIKQICLKWQEEGGPGPLPSYSCTFSLPVSFCQEHQIILSNNTELDNSNVNENHFMDSYFQDYVCVRYSGMEIPDDPALNESIALLVNNQVPVCWVGHCRVMWIRISSDNVLVKLLLLQNSVALPAELLSQQASRKPCTMEWITKSKRDRYMQYAVQSLTNSSTLACDIALDRSSTSNGDRQDIDMMMQNPVLSVPRFNESQIRALKTSVNQSFTAIDGPPGSGKSILAVRLAFLFSQLNSSSSPSPSVLLCGPSDVSLDKLAEYLLSFGSNCPKILRVYGDNIEQAEFPLPGVLRQQKNQQEVRESLSDSKKEIAIHHVIRQPGNRYSQMINEYDTLFTLYPDDITADQVQEYNAAVRTAKKEELASAQVILCACADSADIELGSNIKQIVIDDAGMCSEPETMIPIVQHRSATRVVIIGDHAQMLPKVNSETALNLGLDSSLLQRYLDKAVTLTTHYRMTESMAAFPSDYFYDDDLQVGSTDQRKMSPVNIWPAGRDKPFLFCHVDGREEELIVNPVKNRQNAFCNSEEINYAVLAAGKLVTGHGVAENDVVVISQYETQCVTIQKLLQDKGYRRIKVCNVVNCQGDEWDYVILSMVRSLPNHKIPKRSSETWRKKYLGWSADQYQINVALSRAKKGLIILGNKDLLSCDLMWDSLIEMYRDYGALIDAQKFASLLG